MAIFATAVLWMTVQATHVVAADEAVWGNSYRDAMNAAKRDNQMMLVYFHKDGLSEKDDALFQKLTTDPKLRSLTGNFELVRIPIARRANVGGKEIQLITHSAFQHLGIRPGLVIIDFLDPDSPHYGNVVSVYPLDLAGALDTKHLAALMELPTGSLTQRSLIWAVRVHPEKPASTDGVFMTSLAKETKSHSGYQASIRRQGHHQWESRFHRINNKLPNGLLAQEVCAESWPGKKLMAAAIDCVASWRQSSGHWSAVRGSHPHYAYDMKRGSNGIWYATGIFSNRR